MEYLWTQKAELQGWARWRRHALVLGVTLSLNLIIFLTIPFMSQIREAEHEDYRIAGIPTMVTMQPEENSQADARESQKPPEPEELQKLPQPKFRPQQMEFSPPSPPDLPALEFDMPEMDLGRIAISQPQEPKPAASPRQPSPESESGQPEKTPEPSAQQTEFSLSEVDSHPRLVRKVNPTYPFRAKRRGVEGKVSLRFLVDKQGRVSEFNVVQAEPEGVFEESALAAVRQWRFEPGKKDGEPVSTWVQVPIRFELSR